MSLPFQPARTRRLSLAAPINVSLFLYVEPCLHKGYKPRHDKVGAKIVCARRGIGLDGDLVV